MVANLNGVVFGQVYGDNSGGAEFDTDGDGTATQEDEFVSFTNTTGGSIDISGWEIWADSPGFGAPDAPVSGLYHTFPPGTVLSPGQTLYIVNEITGPAPGWAQEATAGGVESGAGGISTNFLSEGMPSEPESIALVDPVSGDYIVFNMDLDPPEVNLLPGFTGTSNVGTVAASLVQEDQNAGSSYQYNSGTDSYEYSTVFVPCFAAGTLIETPNGACPVEDLCTGDLVCTLDNGPQPVRLMLVRRVRFDSGAHENDRPILFQPGALGPDRPDAPLAVSPQHRMLVERGDGTNVLVPAKALHGRRGVRVMHGKKQVCYHHLVFDRHEIVMANNTASESYLGGAAAMNRVPPRIRLAVERAREYPPRGHVPARQCIGAGAYLRLV